MSDRKCNTPDELKSLALELLDQQREREMNSGWPDWKASIFALSRVRALIESRPPAGAPGEYACALLQSLEQFRDNYSDNKFIDEYSAAKGSIGGVITKIRSALSDRGVL